MDKFSLCGVEYQVLSSVIFISCEISDLTKYRELTFQVIPLGLFALRDHLTEGLVQPDMNLYKLFEDEIFFCAKFSSVL